MKKFLEEFKAFALKGNVMDMSIGVIVGAAFGNIVSSLTARTAVGGANTCASTLFTADSPC